MGQQLYAGIYIHIHSAHCGIRRAWVTGFFSTTWELHVGAWSLCGFRRDRPSTWKRDPPWELLNKPQRKSLDFKWFQGSGNHFRCNWRLGEYRGRREKGVCFELFFKGVYFWLERERENWATWPMDWTSISTLMEAAIWQLPSAWNIFPPPAIPCLKDSLLHVRAHLFHLHWEMGGRINSSG